MIIEIQKGKLYIGNDAEKLVRDKPGVRFIAQDTRIMYFYNTQGNPIKLGLQATELSFAEVVAVPATATSTGTTGQIAIEAGFIYTCVATNSWERVATAAWV
jgi:hypothetical protein